MVLFVNYWEWRSWCDATRAVMLERHPERLDASLYRREYLGDGIATGLSVATMWAEV